MKNTKYLLLTIAALALPAFPAAEVGAAAPETTREAAVENIPYVTVTFSPGSDYLSETSQSQLRALLEQTRSRGLVSSVTVAAWSDAPAPPSGQMLSESDVELAEARLSSVADFIEIDLGVDQTVNTFNMADGSNWLGMAWDASAAQLDVVFADRTGYLPVTRSEFELLRNQGTASAAVVLVEAR